MFLRDLADVLARDRFTVTVQLHETEDLQQQLWVGRACDLRFWTDAVGWSVVEMRVDRTGGSVSGELEHLCPRIITVC